MNGEKLRALQAQVRIGGKGTARRKKKVISHKTAAMDEKKLQNNFKKLAVTSIPGIEEVNMFKEDGSIMHFNNPKVQASVPANTFAISGQPESKQMTELLPGILNQLGPESFTHLKRLIGSGSNYTIGGMSGLGAIGAQPIIEQDEDDDVPELVGDFDEPSKQESVTAATQSQL